MITAVAEDGRTLSLSSDGLLGDCLTWDELVESVTISLCAWFTSGLDLNLLVRNDLPVWCAQHRTAGTRSPCGLLRVTNE